MTSAKKERGGKVRTMIFSCHEIVTNIQGGRGEERVVAKLSLSWQVQLQFSWAESEPYIWLLPSIPTLLTTNPPQEK